MNKERFKFCTGYIHNYQLLCHRKEYLPKIKRMESEIFINLENVKLQTSQWRKKFQISLYHPKEIIMLLRIDDKSII